MNVHERKVVAAGTPGESPDPLAPLITVAICTRNRAAFLQRAIESVVPQLTDDAELLLVDNASTDDTPKIVSDAAAKPRVRAVRESELGLSIARNTALREARGKWVVYLDDDAQAEPGWLSAYRGLFSGPPPADAIAVVGGCVIPDYEAAPPRWFDPGFYAYDLGSTPQLIVDHRGPWGCNIAYLREPAIRAGMFDVKLGRKGAGLGAHEEIELILRLEKAGFCVWWLPTARIRHFVAAQRVSLSWQWRSEFGQSRSRTIMKLQAKTRSQRLFYSITHLLGAPFQIPYYWLSALLKLPSNPTRAAMVFLRSARIAGFATESLVNAICLGKRP